MSTFLSIRNYVHFRRYFAAVHPFFWPVLYWQLKRAWLALQREKRTSFLLAISWWGGVRIVHRGDIIAAPQPNPLALTRPRWDDPVWYTDVPEDFLNAPFIRTHAAGGGGISQREMTEGALPSPPCDSS